jgi:hypothetical protein
VERYRLLDYEAAKEEFSVPDCGQAEFLKR